MKKLLFICALLGGILFANAQEKPKGTFEKDGKLIKATYYHDNGEVSQTGYYNKAGNLQGTWKSFDKNGNKVAIAQYNDGKKEGKWFFWTDGTLKEVDYADSEITNVNTWQVTEQVVSNE